MPVEINQKVQQKTHLNISSLETIFTIISGAAAAFLGTISIIGLFFNIVFLSAVLPEFKPIAVSAAIAWIFFGLVLVIHAKKPLTGARLTVVTAFLVVIAMAAALDIPLKLKSPQLQLFLSFFLQSAFSFCCMDPAAFRTVRTPGILPAFQAF
jgi:hypothetical protein